MSHSCAVKMSDLCGGEIERVRQTTLDGLRVSHLLVFILGGANYSTRGASHLFCSWGYRSEFIPTRGEDDSLLPRFTFPVYPDF
jgi:hypothetical protein